MENVSDNTASGRSTPSDVSEVSTFFNGENSDPVPRVLNVTPVDEVESFAENGEDIQSDARPSTSRGFVNEYGETNQLSSNSEETSLMRSAIDNEGERIFLNYMRESRSREFKEAMHQRDRPSYLDFLFTIEPEIDAFLETENSVLTDRICTYANHSWPYNHLNLERKHRLSRIRMSIEKFEIIRKDAKYEEYINHAHSNEKEAEKLKPICIICTLDIRNDYFAPLALNCGHTFHNKCIRKQLRKNRECPICRSPVQNLDGTRLYLSY